jgi:hypothetical protein
MRQLDAPVGGNHSCGGPRRGNRSGSSCTSVLLPLLNRALSEDSCMAGTVYLGRSTLS